MGLSHPMAATVVPTVELVQDILGGKIDGALKREFSSHNQHVYTQHTKDAVEKFKEALRQENAAYSKTTFRQPKWFIQPYIAPLFFLGEIRVFIVNGVIFKAIVTTPNSEQSTELEIENPLLLTPLSKLR
jgi:hypothetical protein